MTPFLKLLLLCLTVITVGVAQVAGAQASFFCSFTGKKTLQPSCGSSCHGGLPGHDSSCPGGHEQNDSEHEEDPIQPAPPAHRHGQVVESLIATHAPATWHTPAVIWLAVLTDPFPAFLNAAPAGWWPPCRIQPHQWRLKAGSVVIPRTMVMLV